MLEKEILTKKQLVKMIMPKIRDVLLATLLLLLLAIAFFSLYQLYFSILNEDYSDIYNDTGMLIMTFGGSFLKWIAIFCILAIIEVWISCFYTVICLYRNKFYLIVAPLKAKSKKEKRHGRWHYTEYSFNFDKLGTFKTPYGYVFYPFSKYDKMEPEMADKITELGEEFFLLVRGGKRKKIVHIFHKRLFDIQEDEYLTKIKGRYYI